jgi:hypothetical protein
MPDVITGLSICDNQRSFADKLLGCGFAAPGVLWFNSPVADHLTPEHRSWNMAQIKGKDTRPEVLVRSMLHRAGYRFRKNGKEF